MCLFGHKAYAMGRASRCLARALRRCRQCSAVSRTDGERRTISTTASSTTPVNDAGRPRGVSLVDGDVPRRRISEPRGGLDVAGNAAVGNRAEKPAIWGERGGSDRSKPSDGGAGWRTSAAISPRRTRRAKEVSPPRARIAACSTQQPALIRRSRPRQSRQCATSVAVQAAISAKPDNPSWSMRSAVTRSSPQISMRSAWPNPGDLQSSPCGIDQIDPADLGHTIIVLVWQR